MPELSIITVNLNNSSGLAKTIESVRNQLFKNYEYIIVDGGSTDGSLKIIKGNKDIITHCISEKDSGIYNAMNKGIIYAKGKYILFLNSGDYLINEDALSTDFQQHNEDLLYGYLSWGIGDNIHTSIYPDQLDLGFFYRTTLPHGSTFIKKELFDECGLYREDYRIISDWIYFYNSVLILNRSYFPLKRAISVFEHGGISSIPENSLLVKQERDRFLNSVLDKYVIDYLQLIREKEETRDRVISKLTEEYRTLHGRINNLLRLKGINQLKKLNDVLDKFYLIIKSK